MSLLNNILRFSLKRILTESETFPTTDGLYSFDDNLQDVYSFSDGLDQLRKVED